MKLDHCKTEPSIRSSLTFTEAEVIEALYEHASRKGYGFNKYATFQIRFPDRRLRLCDHNTALVTIGTVAGIVQYI